MRLHARAKFPKLRAAEFVSRTGSAKGKRKHGVSRQALPTLNLLKHAQFCQTRKLCYERRRAVLLLVFSHSSCAELQVERKAQ